MSKVNSKVITGTHLSHFPTASGFWTYMDNIGVDQRIEALTRI